MLVHDDSIIGLVDDIGRLSAEILREIPPELNEGVEILYGKENMPSIKQEIKK
jgi:hypothetical protein